MMNQIKMFGPQLRSLAAFVLTLGLASSATAVTSNNFQPSPGPHNLFVTHLPAVLPHLRLSAGWLGSYGADPVVYRDANGQKIGDSIVGHAVSNDLALALGLGDRFEIGLTLPTLYLQGAGFDGGGLSSFGVGDARLILKSLLTSNNRGFVASFRLASDMPLSQLNENTSLAGDGQFNGLLALSTGFEDESFRMGADFGVLLRQPTTVGNTTIGHAFTYGFGTEIDLVPETMTLVADLFGQVAPASLGGTVDQYPVEAALGLRYFFDGAFLQGGAGTGLFPDYGTPAYRVFLGAGYYQRTPYDRDEDGIPNRDDLCVDDPETINGFEDSDGCPDVRPVPKDDQDEDGILNDVDECPELPEDKDQFEDEDGCPDSDNDKDGISDKRDECPNQAEDRDGWEDADGCPEEDNDEDGINDADDDCPNDPETLNDVDDEDGCPDGDNVKVVVKRGAVEIKEKVYFESNSSNIMSKSFGLLNDVAAVFNQHVYIKKILVGGHTDSTGDDKYNLDLSERRAQSVRMFLIGAGVAEERLDARGFGETEPLVSNKNKKGRETNRRVEFKITDDGVEEAPVVEEEAEAVKDEDIAVEEIDDATSDVAPAPASTEAAPEEPDAPLEPADDVDDDMPQGDE